MHFIQFLDGSLYYFHKFLIFKKKLKFTFNYLISQIKFNDSY